MHQPDSRQGRWVPFDQARMILHMSEGTLRRAIRDGTVVAEQRRRNPDSATDLRMVYEVLVPEPPAADAPSESAPASEPPAATMRLLDMLGERDATVERLHGELLVATERAARAEAERDAARETADDLRRRLEAAEWRWWHRFVKR